MVIGEPLDLLLLLDGHVPLSHSLVQGLAPFHHLRQPPVSLQELLQALHRLLILLHVLEAAVSMDIRLEVLLHGSKKPLLLFPYAKVGEKLLLCGRDRSLAPAVKIQQVPVMKELCGDLHVKDPLIINAVNMAVRDHEIFK